MLLSVFLHDFLMFWCYMFSGNKFKTSYELGNCELDIVPAWAEDIAEYKCVAINKWGQDQTVGSLNVLPAAEKGMPPVWIVPFKNTQVTEGDEAVFEGKVVPVDDPDLKLEWFLNDKPLHMGMYGRNHLLYII